MPNVTTEAAVLVLLTAGSLAAGFLAASAPADAPPADTLATLGPGGDAFEITLNQGETLTLVASDGTQPGQYALFDPEDVLVAHPRIGPADRETIPIDQEGEWVLMRTTGPSTTVDVGITSPQDPSMERVQSIPVQDHRRSLMEQQNGSAELQAPFELHRAPAIIYLDLEGSAQAFNATVQSQEGTVFETTAPNVNGSTHLLTLETTTATPGNIEPGLYRVSADAEQLEGALSLVHRTYVRDTATLEVAEQAAPGTHEEGVPIAAIPEGEAVHVPGNRTDRIVLAVAAQSSATALVYDERSHVRAVVGLNEADGYDWEFSDGEAPLVETASFRLQEEGTYTVYVQNVEGEDDQLYVLAPDVRTAEPALEATLQETRLSLGSGTASTSEQHEVETRLPGGLVDASVDVDAVASGDQTVRVFGPLGLLYRHEAQTTAAGETLESQTVSNPSHFTAGTFTVQVEEEQSVDSSVHVTLRYFQPAARS